MGVVKQYQTTGEIRSNAQKQSHAAMSASPNTCLPRNQTYTVIVTGIDGSQGINVYTVCLRGLNGAITTSLHTALAIDNSTAFSIGDSCAMFIDQEGRAELINAGGGTALIPKHTHPQTVSAGTGSI